MVNTTQPNGPASPSPHIQPTLRASPLCSLQQDALQLPFSEVCLHYCLPLLTLAAFSSLCITIFSWIYLIYLIFIPSVRKSGCSSNRSSLAAPPALQIPSTGCCNDFCLSGAALGHSPMSCPKCTRNVQVLLKASFKVN